MRPGATPKLKKSARLSSSAPKREVPLIMRATRPSTASSIAANTIAPSASSRRPSSASRIAVRPAHSASSVMTLGTSVRNGIWRNRRSLRSRRSGSNRVYGMDHNIQRPRLRRHCHDAHDATLTHPVQAFAPAEAPAPRRAPARRDASRPRRATARRTTTAPAPARFRSRDCGAGACAAAPKSCRA